MGTMGLDSIFSRSTQVSSSEGSSSEAEETKPIHEDGRVGGSTVSSPDEAPGQPSYVDWEGKRKPVKKWFGIL